MSHNFNFLVKNAPLHLEKHLIYPHIPLRITVGLQPIPADIGYTLDRLSVHHRANGETNNHTFSDPHSSVIWL